MNDEQLADASQASGFSGRTAVVVGGGLAGVTAALALADAGVRVTLLEGRPGSAVSPSPSGAAN